MKSNLILVEVEEVKATVMLVDRVLVVVTPQVEGPHLVPLVQTARTPALHGQGATTAGVLGPWVAPGVRVALESGTTLTSRLSARYAARCSETTLDDRTWVGGAGNLQRH